MTRQRSGPHHPPCQTWSFDASAQQIHHERQLAAALALQSLHCKRRTARTFVAGTCADAYACFSMRWSGSLNAVVVV